MLAELEIRDLALLARARLSLRPGLVALTGATGVGKSLVLEALGLLAGGRASPEIVRTGADAAVVRGLFQLDAARAAEAAGALGIDPPEGGEILIERRVEAGGRGRATANGSPVTVAALREAARRLVEIHGQSEHQRLLDPRAQAELLDRSGGCEEARARFTEALRGAREARTRRADLEGRRRERLARIDLLDHAVATLGRAALRPGEKADLERERARFDGAERYLGDLHAAVEALSEGEGSAADRLGAARSALGRAADLEPRLAAARDRVEEALAAAADAAREAARARDGAEFEPARREAVEERLEDAIAATAEATRELATLRAEEEDRASASGREAAAAKSLAAAGRALVKSRRAAAKSLEKGVLAGLGDLSLGAARFSVAVGEGEGDLVETASEAGPGPVEFLFSANPGEPLLPLARVASGGELARVSLALRARLAAADRTPVLVFDEVDAEVGGRLGPAVAEKLRAVATGRQVLVVTHLASIAAAADQHLRVAKEVAGGRTTAAVEELSGAARERELAEMLHGEGNAERGLGAARVLLQGRAPRRAR
jgi:DNA repair protein RecN (Recombination protein N)